MGLDPSGLSPSTLKRVLDQTTRLPFREAREALEIQGLGLSLSHCERLTQSYAEVFEASCVAQLKNLAEQPLATGNGPTRTDKVRDGYDSCKVLPLRQ